MPDPMLAVSETLTNLDGTTDRARRSLRRFDGQTVTDTEAALYDALTDLEAVRKRLMRRTYYGSTRA